MICENCYISSQLDALGRYLIDKNQGKNFFEITDEYMHANNEYSCCSRCDNKIEIGDLIYENEENLQPRVFMVWSSMSVVIYMN